MYYTISGWDWAGNQIVKTIQAYTEEEAEKRFLESINGGEVNEILDSFSEEEYKNEIMMED